MLWVIGFWMGCSFGSEVGRDTIQMHSRWSTLRSDYQQAIALYKGRNFAESVVEFRSLHSQYPESRAVLEGLLMSELQSEEDLPTGYTRIQKYVQAHPGDMAFRLIQSKFHLKQGAFEQGRADLELLLFNQAFHPWELAQDSFLQQFKSHLDLEKIPFDLMHLLELEWPTAAVVGDTNELRLSILHLSSCNPYVPAVEIDLTLDSKRLSVYRETVDSFVTKTTFVQSFTNLSSANDVSGQLDIVCDTTRFSVQLPTITVIDLDRTSLQEKPSSITFPNVTELVDVEDGIPWTLYVNHVEAGKGFWNPNMGK